MTTMIQPNDTKDKKSSRWYVIAACALMGAVIGYVGSDLITGGANDEKLDISLSVIVAVGTGMVLMVCVMIVGLGFGFQRIGLTMKMFEDPEQWEDERSMMLLSAIGGGAYALALILLALAEPIGLIGSFSLLAALGVLAAIFTYASVRLLREYDELWLGVNSETSLIAFYITLAIGGVWSTLAHLKFAPALAPLDWITLMTVACIIGALIATQRRGMLED
jgi:hypothetical protein